MRRDKIVKIYLFLGPIIYLSYQDVSGAISRCITPKKKSKEFFVSLIFTKCHNDLIFLLFQIEIYTTYNLISTPISSSYSLGTPLLSPFGKAPCCPYVVHTLQYSSPLWVLQYRVRRIIVVKKTSITGHNSTHTTQVYILFFMNKILQLLCCSRELVKTGA